VIALVGPAHGVSHFFHLLLPPLFPWLMPEFGLDFVGIGSTMTVFFVVSGVGQALSGLAVDRFGPVRVLAAGISCFIAAGVLLAQADSFAALMLVAAVAGLGNSVFHPCDFTILNRNVSTPRLGHAFSVHGLSGNLGWALAPVFMTGIAAHSGWRVAALAAGLLAVPALALIVLGRRHLVDESRDAAPAGRPVTTLEILKVGPVWMCFAFFFLLTMAFGAFQNFGAPLMQGLYDMSVAVQRQPCPPTCSAVRRHPGRGLPGPFGTAGRGHCRRPGGGGAGGAAVGQRLGAGLCRGRPDGVHRLSDRPGGPIPGSAGAPCCNFPFWSGGLWTGVRLRLFGPGHWPGPGTIGVRGLMDGGRFTTVLVGIASCRWSPLEPPCVSFGLDAIARPSRPGPSFCLASSSGIAMCCVARLRHPSRPDQACPAGWIYH
jgi:MFS family permease